MHLFCVIDFHLAWYITWVSGLELFYVSQRKQLNDVFLWVFLLLWYDLKKVNDLMYVALVYYPFFKSQSLFPLFAFATLLRKETLQIQRKQPS